MTNRTTMVNELSEWHGIPAQFFAHKSDRALQVYFRFMRAGQKLRQHPARAVTPISIPI